MVTNTQPTPVGENVAPNLPYTRGYPQNFPNQQIPMFPEANIQSNYYQVPNQNYPSNPGYLSNLYAPPY